LNGDCSKAGYSKAEGMSLIIESKREVKKLILKWQISKQA